MLICFLMVTCQMCCFKQKKKNWLNIRWFDSRLHKYWLTHEAQGVLCGPCFLCELFPAVYFPNRYNLLRLHTVLNTKTLSSDADCILISSLGIDAGLWGSHLLKWCPSFLAFHYVFHCWLVEIQPAQVIIPAECVTNFVKHYFTYSLISLFTLIKGLCRFELFIPLKGKDCGHPLIRSLSLMWWLTHMNKSAWITWDWMPENNSACPLTQLDLKPYVWLPDSQTHVSSICIWRFVCWDLMLSVFPFFLLFFCLYLTAYECISF